MSAANRDCAWCSGRSLTSDCTCTSHCGFRSCGRAKEAQR